MFKDDRNVIVKELNNEAKTPSSPRNYGMLFVTAPYLGFLDADDGTVEEPESPSPDSPEGEGSLTPDPSPQGEGSETPGTNTGGGDPSTGGSGGEGGGDNGGDGGNPGTDTD